MADQIVITEKSSQAEDVRAAVEPRYGGILPAEGHLFDLLEPEDIVPEWKRSSPSCCGLKEFRHRPAEGSNRTAKLRAIREALRTAKRDWLATDCDRRVSSSVKGDSRALRMPWPSDAGAYSPRRNSPTIRDAFGRAKPNAEYARLYAAAVARRPCQPRSSQPVTHPHHDRHPESEATEGGGLSRVVTHNLRHCTT